MATDGDLDAISLTSTALSEQEEEYPVEAILAETEVDGKHPRFLVKWEGYPDVRATWEPATSFDDESTFLEWEARKRRQNQGLEPAFDVEDWQARVNAIESEKAERKARRKAKRKRLGIPTSSDEGEDGEGGGGTQDDSDKAPTSVARRSRRRDTSVQVGDDDSGPDTVKLSKDSEGRKKRRHSAHNSDESNDGLTSDDSLLEDIKVKQFNKKHKRLRKKTRARESTSSTERVIPRRPQGATANQSKPPSRRVSLVDTPKPAKGRPTARRAANPRTPKVISNVLANWDKEPPKQTVAKPDYNNPSRPPLQKPQLFSKPSTLRRFEKAGRNERPPQEGALQLFKPGEWNPRSMHKTQPSDPGPSQDGTKTGNPGEEDFGSRERSEVGGGQNEESPKGFQPAYDTTAPGSGRPPSLYKRPSIAQPRRSSQPALPISPDTAIQTPIAQPQQILDANVALKPTIKKLSLSEYNQRRLPDAGKKNLEGSINPTAEEIKDNRSLETDLTFRAHELIEATTRLPEQQSDSNVPVEAAHLSSTSVSVKIGVSAIEVGQMELIGKLPAALQSKWTDFKVLWLKEVISAEHFHKIWELNKDKVLGEGDAEASSQELLDILRLYSGAGVMNVSTFVLIIYPSSVEAWQYMKRTEEPTATQLKWVAFSPKFNSENPTTSIGRFISSTSTITWIYPQFFRIQYPDLFPTPITQSGKEFKLQVFIMADVAAEWNELILIYQLLRTYGITVFWSGQDGAWDYFSQHVNYGILFVSNNYRRRGIASVPKLTSVLSKTINIFEFGRRYYVSQSGTKTITSRGKFSCYRLFPHGGCILLTDTTLMTDPQNAYVVLRWFKKRITESKASTWKLILRRGDVESWVLKAMVSKAAADNEDPATLNARNDIYQAISELLYKPPGRDHGDLDVQQVAGEDIEEINSPVLQVANLAIWADVHCTTYRRFIAVHPTPIPDADAFQVVQVMTVDQFLRKHGR
ncbi:MAG: hypothetical protein M1839_009239 [Geoglossum umbratile]|nr:MAG: hypothetical protein M1839_009239 [Geoglossum umbratile]